jgi:hypothetical protein
MTFVNIIYMVKFTRTLSFLLLLEEPSTLFAVNLFGSTPSPVRLLRKIVPADYNTESRQTKRDVRKVHCPNCGRGFTPGRTHSKHAK